MTIQEYIGKVFRDRLERSPCLVIYDGERRFRDAAMGIADTRLHVVDAGAPVIEAREQALDIWQTLADRPDERLVVYVPRSKPVYEEGKLVDPYLIWRVAGAVFPEGASDEYQALCQQAFPEHADRIAALFRDGVPDFAAVNALQSGPTWPRLRAVLGLDIRQGDPVRPSVSLSRAAGPSIERDELGAGSTGTGLEEPGMRPPGG